MFGMAGLATMTSDPRSPFAAQTDATFFLEAAVVALIGATTPLSPELRVSLGEFAMYFGAALRLEPTMRDPAIHRRIHAIAESAIEQAHALLQAQVKE